MAEVRSLEQVVSAAFSQERFTMLLLGSLRGAGAPPGGSVGIYGVISLIVAQRTHEFGIRMALGAERATILRMVVGQGMLLAAGGIAVGVLGAALLARSLRSLVYGMGTLDPPTFLVVPALLAAVTLLACWLPARRATRVDPMVALRRR